MTSPDAQRVIVRDGGMEVHGYAVASDGRRVYVVWEVASGRRRQRSFNAETVFVPGTTLPWAGVPIPVGQLGGPYRLRQR
ncbi:hypothetical protein [Sinomonas atrocyanea]|uniref:hypothetical protein n=1 Tax=Sinomonas atrocyanea TaxID=37927 RepID=UPI00285ADCE0|nr:hypothetical protein [Sinomonas atrocyanea]MDR6620466.1 hypothetical protein [Sinomonas atrocyanea]